MIDKIFKVGYADFFYESNYFNPYYEESEERASWEAGFNAAKFEFELFLKGIRESESKFIEE